MQEWTRMTKNDSKNKNKNNNKNKKVKMMEDVTTVDSASDERDFNKFLLHTKYFYEIFLFLPNYLFIEFNCL